MPHMRDEPFSASFSRDLSVLTRPFVHLQIDLKRSLLGRRVELRLQLWSLESHVCGQCKTGLRFLDLVP